MIAFDSTFFIIVILLLLVIVATIFLILKSNKKAKQNINSTNYFLNKLKAVMSEKYPNIPINYERIEEILQEDTSKNEEIVIVEEVLSQFVKYQVELKPNRIPREQLWSSYEEMSFPIKGKIPKDFQKRKVAIYMNRGGKCQRCGKKLKIEDVAVYLIRSIEKQGNYHLENLALLCYDCNRVLTTEDVSKVSKSLKIYYDLLDLIK